MEEFYRIVGNRIYVRQYSDTKYETVMYAL